MTVPEKIIQLVDHFAQNLDAYQHGKYNETQTRQEFINPFFKALGWDIDNESGQSELNKDVIHEDAVKVELAIKAPDYSFRLAGVRKFFVEAKKPAVNIKNDPSPAYQLRRYGWSAKLPLSILTNFAEFAVYDCRIQPNKNDSAATARILYLTFTEYVDKWPELVKIFSKDAIQHGAFDSYAEAVKTKKGSAEVDVAFLQEIEQWREQLAVHLALRNPGLTRRELNYAVQRTIDRIVFLRICEDRGIEQYGRLQALQTGTHVYSNLIQLFHQADDRYNSGIFHFKSERDNNEPPDTLTPQLIIDDAALKNIIKRLYYPDSPYAFAVIPAAILGQVYEQFLGKVITLDKQHRATVETKPEVKKSGGVYYTPDYIVEYIVTNTLGKFLNGKNLASIKTLTILDPACGSGSFLIVAYQYLLDWYLAQYMADDPKKWSKGKQPRLYQLGNQWKLTITERKRILLAHIHGVDIDSQAIEVTKLSLFLKVLEGENDQTLNSQMALFRERVLPVLSKNIKCGNSLIGSDFYADKQLHLIDEEELYRVNVFDWNKEFSEIIKSGGFDIVIGNPPYIDSEWLVKTNPNLRTYCNAHYNSAKGNWDIFCIFVEKALSLCRQNGLSSMIVPNKIFAANYASTLRSTIIANSTLKSIRDYSDISVFPVAVYPIVYVVQAIQTVSENVMFEKIKSVSDNQKEQIITKQIPWILFINLNGKSWSVLFREGAANLVSKIQSRCTKLGDLAEVVGAATVSEAYELIFFIEEFSDQTNEYYIFINTGTIDRYKILWGKRKTTYIKNFFNKPIVAKHAWQKISSTRIKQASQRKIIIGGMNKQLECVLDDGKCFAGKSTSIILNPKVDIVYLTALVNSKLLSYFYRTVFSALSLKGGFLRIGPPQIKQLPIRPINFSDPAEKAQHDKMVTLVDQMLTLHKQLAAATIPQTQTMLQRQINNTDQQIDQLVYELYGLSAEEIKIVEEGE